MNEVAIIGGGASGLTAAVFAAENNVKVTIYESSGRVGRKILATGNGRCNLTNLNADIGNYYGENPEFISYAKHTFWVNETIEFFASLGILTKSEDNGKVYPYSDQASAVLDVLRFKADELNIKIETSFEVCKVKKNKDKFLITAFDGREAYADKVIVATGGKAAPDLGSKGIGYEILQSFGHKMTKLQPSLVQIKTEPDVVKKLKGIKLNAVVSLKPHKEFGEVLFTEYGLSGPAVFSLSSRLKKQKALSLDIMPEYSKEQIYEMINTRIYNNPKRTLENFFVGVLNKRVGQSLLKFAGIEPLSRYAVTLSQNEIMRLCDIIKKWDFNMTGTMSWNNAQVTKGGICTNDFNPKTMESKLTKGLYACGEVLDIDGDCGGYNLQWAWSSGFLAGSSV